MVTLQPEHKTPGITVNILAEAWFRGDEQAGAQLFRICAGTVEQVIKKHLNKRYRSRVDPDDVSQSVFLDMFYSLRKEPIAFKSNESFACWIRRFAQNKTIKRITYENAEKRNPNRESETDYEPVRLELTPMETLIREEEVDQAMSRLSNVEQAIANMLRQGFSQTEIAREMNLSTRTIRRKMPAIRDAFQQLQDSYETTV